MTRLLRFGQRPAVTSVFDQAVVSGFGFLTGIVAARLIGIEEFGLFVLILIVTAFAQGLHNAVVTAPMMTLVGAERRSAGTYDVTVLAAAALLSLLAAAGVAVALVGIFLARHHPVEIGGVLAATALAFSQNMQFTLRRMMFARGSGLTALAMDAMRALAFPAALFVVWASGGTLNAVSVTWALAASAFVTMLPLAWMVLRRRQRGLRLRAVARRHWDVARWLLPVVFVTFGQEQMAWILAGIILGDEAIGGLRAAQYLVGFVLILLTATENILPTAAARARESGGEAALQAYLVKATLTIGPVVGLLLLTIALPAGTWLHLVFGAAFENYAAGVRILAIGVVFIFLRDMTTQYFRAIQDTAVVFRAFVASLFVSLTIMYPLIAYDGVTGAAFVVAIGHATSAIYLIAKLMQRRTPRSRAVLEPKVGLPGGGGMQ